MTDVIVEDVGPCKKQLKVTVPQTDIQAKVEETYTRLRTTAVVDGFRKGHIPRKLLERRFGEEVLEEVKQAVLNKASQAAFEEKKLKPLGEPSFDNIDFGLDKDCVFEITLEVEPEFELPEYKGLKLQKKAPKVGDDELRQALERLRTQHANLELMSEDAEVRADDMVVCDWALASGDESVASEKDDQFIVGGRRFGGVELEKEMSEALAGAKSGDVREIRAKFLDSYPIEKWREKEGLLTLTPKEIRRPVLPDLDDVFAKRLDFDSVDDLEKYVRASLMRSKESEVAMDLERQTFDQLLERAPFELPEGVHKAQSRNIMVRQQFRLRQRGIPDEEIEKHLDELRNASEEVAARNLKIFFMSDRIAEKEKIFVTENDVENRIGTLANSYRMSSQRMRAQIEQDGSLSQLRVGMREDKVVDFLLKNAEIEEEKE